MDSARKTSGNETRMLERRVSNNRADLSGDQRMNYFLSWFQTWSELQKSDFVPVLTEKMSDKDLPSTTADMKTMHINGDTEDKKDKPPSLFECQLKLFKDWFSSWSDDQKNYLVMRLQAIDADFFAKFEAHGANASPEKDYFEPGVPAELVRKSSRSVLGPHAATFNAHGSLPDQTQPKSFMSSTNVSSVDSLGNSSNHSTSSTSETEDDVDLIKSKQTAAEIPPAAATAAHNLSTITE